MSSTGLPIYGRRLQTTHCSRRARGLAFALLSAGACSEYFPGNALPRSLVLDVKDLLVTEQHLILGAWWTLVQGGIKDLDAP